MSSFSVADDVIDGFVVSDTDDDGTPNYYGFVRPDGSWYILKETLAAGNNTYRYFKGSTNYATNWTNRASLAYDYFYVIYV